MNGKMMKNGATYLHKCGDHANASCSNSKATRRVSKHAARQSERRAWKREVW